MPIKNCMIQHLFDYKPNNEKVFIKEYLCDCEQCLKNLTLMDV